MPGTPHRLGAETNPNRGLSVPSGHRAGLGSQPSSTHSRHFHGHSAQIKTRHFDEELPPASSALMLHSLAVRNSRRNSMMATSDRSRAGGGDHSEEGSGSPLPAFSGQVLPQPCRDGPRGLRRKAGRAWAPQEREQRKLCPEPWRQGSRRERGEPRLLASRPRQLLALAWKFIQWILTHLQGLLQHLSFAHRWDKGKFKLNTKGVCQTNNLPQINAEQGKRGKN